MLVFGCFVRIWQCVYLNLKFKKSKAQFICPDQSFAILLHSIKGFTRLLFSVFLQEQYLFY